MEVSRISTATGVGNTRAIRGSQTKAGVCMITSAGGKLCLQWWMGRIAHFRMSSSFRAGTLYRVSKSHGKASLLQLDWFRKDCVKETIQRGRQPERGRRGWQVAVTKSSQLKCYLLRINSKQGNAISILLGMDNITSMMWRNLSSEGGWVACRIRQMCWVSSRDTSRRSPIIMRSSSCDLAPGDSSRTGGSKLRGTSGLLRGCFLGVLEPFRESKRYAGKRGKELYDWFFNTRVEIPPYLKTISCEQNVSYPRHDIIGPAKPEMYRNQPYLESSFWMLMNTHAQHRRRGLSTYALQLLQILWEFLHHKKGWAPGCWRILHWHCPKTEHTDS